MFKLIAWKDRLSWKWLILVFHHFCGLISLIFLFVLKLAVHVTHLELCWWSSNLPLSLAYIPGVWFYRASFVSKFPTVGFFFFFFPFTFSPVLVFEPDFTPFSGFFTASRIFIKKAITPMIFLDCHLHNRRKWQWNKDTLFYSQYSCNIQVYVTFHDENLSGYIINTISLFCLRNVQ